jgi:DNA-binding IclR family transcriptional regulator
LVVASEEQIVVIARVDAPGDLGFVVRVGHRRPLVDSTSGLVLLAFQPDDIRERWLDLAKASGITFERASLLKRATKTRAKGYAQIPSHLVAGVIDLSAPIKQDDIAVATITVPFLKRERTKVGMAESLVRLRAAAAEVSSALSLGSDPDGAARKIRRRKD